MHIDEPEPAVSIPVFQTLLDLKSCAYYSFVEGRLICCLTSIRPSLGLIYLQLNLNMAMSGYEQMYSVYVFSVTFSPFILLQFSFLMLFGRIPIIFLHIFVYYKHYEMTRSCLLLKESHTLLFDRVAASSALCCSSILLSLQL